MKTLHLNLKKKWFDMIASGEKTEEYREIKPYWHNRLLFNEFDQVVFSNGYARNAPRITVKFKFLMIGPGKVAWGAPGSKDVYIIKLGRIISEQV